MFTRLCAVCCFFIVITATSCNLDPCKNFACVNGDPQEDFNDCVCICKAGWSGSDCTLEDKCITRNVRCLNCGDYRCCDSKTGRCNCLTGYEGDSCQILSRARFLNNNDEDSTLWRFTDTCALQILSDTVKIKKGSSNTSLSLFNIFGIDPTVPVKVNMTGTHTFSLPVITIIDSDTVSTLRGTLTQDNQRIKVTYRLNTTGCSGMWLRL